VVAAFLQDMPGWGDEIDLVSNLKTVVQFLLEQRKKDLVDNKAGVTGGTGGPPEGAASLGQG
jgi:hypothetical protein